jgi:hypothetical protein
MKTQIIQLNRNDDYLSVRDKMSWSQAGHILLIWPDHGHVLNRQLDLNLVKRHAFTMGVQVALVTHDAEVRFYAQQIGIPVYGNLHRAQDTPWSINQRRTVDPMRNYNNTSILSLGQYYRQQAPAWLVHPATRIICFGLSVLALFALGIFILPSAAVVLSPQIEIQTLRFDLSADPLITSINYSSGSLPTYIQEVVVEGDDKIPATGLLMIHDEPAIGNIRFTNMSDQKTNIPVGTVVSTFGSNPIRFITSSISEVTVYPNQSVSLLARAIKPGPSGNLPPDQLVSIEGELGLDLTVTNPSSTHGGTDVSYPSPSMLDIRLLRERLRSQLKQTALMQIQSILPDGDLVISPTLTIIDTLEETASPSIGEPGNLLELSMRLRVQSHVVSEKEIFSLVTPIMDSNTPAGFSSVVNTLEIAQLSNPTIGEDGNAHWTISAVRKLQADIPAGRVVNIIIGATVPQAKERLFASLPLTEQPQIVLTPAWWPRLPLLTMRMEVVQSENR